MSSLHTHTLSKLDTTLEGGKHGTGEAVHSGPHPEATLCKKLDIRYGIFLVIFENTPKNTPEYYI